MSIKGQFRKRKQKKAGVDLTREIEGEKRQKKLNKTVR